MTLTRQHTQPVVEVAPPEGFAFRLMYADHIPVRHWTVWYGTELADVETKARRQARNDLRPGSGVGCNLFIIERWVDNEWDGYDEDGNDLTETCFGEES